jgi:T5SS/PEP-CTERM-associated repeat protein
LIIDEDATLDIAQGATMTDQGSLDIVGLTTGGTLVVGQDNAFDDTNMIVGADQDATGVVSVDGAFGFLVAQSEPGASDGTLTIGQDGDGTVDVTDTANFYTATAILGKNSGSTGTLDVENSTWSGSALTVGQSGTGDATIAAGSTMVFMSMTVGAFNHGSIDVTGGSQVTPELTVLGAQSGATGDATVDASTWLGITLTIGQSGTGSASVEAGSTMTLLTDLTVGSSGTGSIDVTGTSQVTTTTAILGEQSSSIGDATIDDSMWSGGTVTVGDAGTGNVTIDTGSTLSFTLATVGSTGAGSIDVTGSSLLHTDTAILAAETASTGNVTINDSTWTGGTLTVGEVGTADAEIEAGSTATFTSIAIGAQGVLDVTGAAGAQSEVSAPHLTLNFGTLVVSSSAEVLMGTTAGASGDISIQGGFALVGLGTVKSDIMLINGGMVQADLPATGVLTVDGNISGVGTIEPLMTLEVNGVIDPGVEIAFSASTGAEVGDLVLDVPHGNHGTIAGFGAGNTIDITGSIYSDAVFTQGTSGSAGTLTLSGSLATPLSIAVEGTYSSDSFLATPGAADTIVTLLCFVEATMIATETGEVKVEDLRTGDRVRCLMRGTAPVAWIGTGRALVTRGRRNAATPVIVRKGALADNVPHRDLRITKGHALYLDGVLIPVEFLINHRSILWDDHAQEVSVYHVELAAHDVLLADGAPAESYRDDGNRWLFRNANIRWDQPPQEACAPVLTGGPMVDSAWRRLLDRAVPRRPLPTTADPDLHLLVDGKRIDAIERRDDGYVFHLSRSPRHARIRSRAAVPQELGLARDDRSLGVAVRRIVLLQPRRQRAIDAKAAALVDGYHAFEPENDIRWTDGDAAVPAELFAGTDGPGMLMLQLAGRTQYLDDGTAAQAA